MSLISDLKILCLDDEPEILDLFSIAIEKAGYTPLTFTDPSKAIAAFFREYRDIAMVFSDFKMPEMTGFEFRQAILRESAGIPFVIVSAYVSREMAIEALPLKISAFLDKPITIQELADIIAREGKDRTENIRECRTLEAIFLEEAYAILDDMEPILLSLDADRTNAEGINAIYRGAHTLKGSSGVLDTIVITRYIHKYEDIISAIKKGDLPFADAVYEVLLKGLDRIKQLIFSIPTKEIRNTKLDDILPDLIFTESSVAKASLAPSVAAAHLAAGPNQENSKSRSKESVSVPITMLDELSGYSGEITVIRNMVNRLVRSLERHNAGNKDVQNLGEMLDEMHKINGTVQSRITDLRKVPLASVLKPIPRIVRDLAKELGKNIKLQIDGETLRVDNSLAAVCSNSLIHLVRNSLDHGIETIAERVTAGKSEQGHITIRCTEGRDEINILVQDDGKGIDPSRIRKKAIDNGLFTSAELGAMSEPEIFAIIFSSGFSTAAVVSDISGRGVGTDMVKSSVESVGGTIKIDSILGSGTTFQLVLPIPKSVMIISSLLVALNDRSYAVPQDNILRVFRLESESYQRMVKTVANGLVLQHNQVVYPLIHLKDILYAALALDPKDASAGGVELVEIILLKCGNIEYAMQVDAIFDSEEIVVKTVQKWANSTGVFAGSTFLADGTVGLILDIKGVADRALLIPAEKRQTARIGQSDETAVSDNHLENFLLFQLESKGVFGVPLAQVFRLEELERAAVQQCGDERVIIYRESVMLIHSASKVLKLPISQKKGVEGVKHSEKMQTIVTRSKTGYIGFEIEKVLDIAETQEHVSTEICDRRGIVGNVFIKDQNVTVLDLGLILNNFIPA